VTISVTIWSRLLSRSERLLEMITLIKAKGDRFTVQEMADQFSVSRRTMLRDLQALSALGVPLSACPGPGGGYSLAYPGSPVTLSLHADEALGLILSYEAVLEDAPSPFSQSSISAITKLRTALSPPVVRDLDRLRERIAVIGMQRIYEAQYLSDLLQAAMEQAHLRIVYDSRSGHSQRLIFPYGLIAALGFWYCACYDYKRRAHAWLRADRISSLERAEQLHPHTPMTLAEWLTQSSATQEETVRLKAKVSARGMKHLDWSAFRDGLAHRTDGSAKIDMSVPLSSLDHYTRLFAPLGAEVVVDSPPHLVQMLLVRAKEIVSLYGRKKSD
jgi:predicted DNA-binding transcriptional regulator YafY